MRIVAGADPARDAGTTTRPSAKGKTIIARWQTDVLTVELKIWAAWGETKDDWQVEIVYFDSIQELTGAEL